MDYSKYLSCLACQESGSYCTKHRSEVESCLRKREVIKILRIHDHQSPRYRHAIKSLLESYDVWKISA